MTDDDILVGYHFAKTGGTTILSKFNSSLGEDACFSYGPYAFQNRFFDGEPLIPAPDSESYARTRLVFGHGVGDEVPALFASRSTHLFCAIRDPLAHAISQYKHVVRGLTARGGKTFTFADFYATRPKNLFAQTIIRHFPGLVDPAATTLLDQVTSVLRNFRFVVSTDRLDDQAAYIYRFAGVPVDAVRKRVYPETVDLGAVSEETVRAENDVDHAINQTVCDFAPPVADAAGDIHFGPFGYDPAAVRERLGALVAGKDAAAIHRSIEDAFVGQLVRDAKLPAAKAHLGYHPRGDRLGKLILERPADASGGKPAPASADAAGDDFLDEFVRGDEIAVGDTFYAAQCLVNEGEVHGRNGNRPAALACFEQAVALNDRNARAHFNIARQKFHLKDFDTAITSVRRAIELDPFRPRMHLVLANALIHARRRKEAIGVLQEAAKLAPNDAQIAAKLEKTIERRKQKAEAKAAADANADAEG